MVAVMVMQQGDCLVIKADDLSIMCYPSITHTWISRNGAFTLTMHENFLVMKGETGSWFCYPAGPGSWISNFVYTTPETPSSFVWPFAPSGITSEWGYRVPPLPGLSNFHSGADFSKAGGTAIKSAGDGTVAMVVSKSNSGNPGGKSWGNRVLIDHGLVNGQQLFTAYAHMRDLNFPLVSVGQAVAAGAKIGEVGQTGSATGNHLHFVTFIGGLNIGPSYTDPKNCANPRDFMATYNPTGAVAA